MMRTMRFFVVHLPALEAAELGGTIEIQLLKADGRADAVGYAEIGSESLEVGGINVGRGVISAGEKMPEGQGVYVNEYGEEIAPF